MSNNLNIILKAKIDSSQNAIIDINKQIDGLSNKLNKLNLKVNIDKNDIDIIKNQVQSVSNTLEKTNQSIKIKNVDETKDKFKDLNNHIKQMLNFNPASTPIEKGMKIIGYSIDDAGNGVKKFTQSLNDGKSNIITYKGTIDQASNSYEVLGRTVKQATRENNTFIKELGIAIQRTITWSIAVGGFYKTLRELKSGVKFVNEISKSLTEIGMVSGLTSSELKFFTQEVNSMARTMAQTTKDMIDSSVLYFRQGKNQTEVLELVKATTVAASIANMDLASTTEYLTSTLNGMKISSNNVMDVIDKFSYVGANAATSFEEISTAMSKTASSAYLAGIDINKLISYIGTVSEVTRESADTIGNSFKTIFARFTNVTQTGMDEDGTGINDVEKALTSINVRLRDSQGQFLDLGSVVDAVGEKFNSLNSVEQNYVATTLAGVRQKDKLIALFSNYNRALQLEELSLQSSGKAMEQYQVYLQGNEAALKKLTAEKEKFFTKLIDSDSLKSVINFGTELIKILDGWINGFGILNTILVGVVPLVGIYFVVSMRKAVASMIEAQVASGQVTTGITSMGAGFRAIIAQLVGTKLAADGTKVSILGLNAATAALTMGLTLLPVIVTAVINAERKRREELEKTVETLNKLNDDISTLENLTKEYKNLEEQQKEGKDVRQELIEVQERLAILFPEVASGVNEEGKAIADNLGLVEQLAEEKKKLLKLELLASKHKSEIIIPILEQEIEKLREEADMLAEKLSNPDREKKVVSIVYNGETIRKEIDDTEELSNRLAKVVENLKNKTEELNKNKNILQQFEVLLESSNKTLDENTTMIDKNNTALNQTTNTIIDLTELHKSLSKTLNDSRSEIMDINEVLNSYNENGKFTQSQMSKLIEKYPQLLSALHDEKKLYEELKKIQKEKVTETQRAFNTELESLKESINEKARGYEIDFNNYKKLEETKLKITKDMVEKVLEEYDKIYDATGDEMKAELHARKTRKRLKETLGSVIPEIDAYLSLQKFDVGSFITSVDSKEKKLEEEWVSSLEVRYRSLQATIDALNKVLDINNEKLNQTDSEVDKINILKQQIEIYKQLQTAMHDMNTERRKEREEIIKQLQGSGISSAKIIDDVGIITDLKQISNLAGESGKKIEELVKRLDSSNSSIRQGSMEWWKYQSSIVGATNEIDNLIKAIQEAEEKALKDMLSAISDVESKIIQIIKKRGEIEREELEKTHKADMESLEERHKAKMDSYKEELDSFRKMIQGQIDALDEQANEEDYIKNLQKEREKANEIQKQIDTLSLDDSLEARNKVIELRKQLADQNEKIADIQTKRERDILKKNLQDQLKDKEENIKQKEDREKSSYDRQKRMMEEDYRKSKEDLDKRYSDHAIYIEARQALEDGYVLDFEGKMVTLEEAYVKFEDRFGAGMGILGDRIKNDFIEKINDAIAAVKKLQSMSINAGSSKGGGGSSSGGGSISDMSESDLNKYLNYKDIWDAAHKSGNDAAKKAANQAAQSLRDKYGIKSDDYSYEELKKLKGYDRGGKIDYNGLAVVHGEDNPEWMLRDHQLKKIISDSVLSTIKVSIPKIPSVATTNMGSINIGSLIGNVQGNLDKSVIPDLERIAKSAVNDIFEQRRRNLNKKGQFATRG